MRFAKRRSTSYRADRERSCIVNLADIHGERPLKGYSVYSIAKAGLIVPTRSLARERQGCPTDTARTVLFLIRDASYVTGQIMAVDGGRSLSGN